METLKLNVTKVEQRTSDFGIVNFKPAKYARVSHRTDGYCLYIEGIDENGKSVNFYTPQVQIRTTDGMLHYRTFTKNTGNFFMEVKGELKGHKSPFDGDTIMPVVIEDRTEIVPAVKVNDEITISYKSKEIKGDKIRLKITRLVS